MFLSVLDDASAALIVYRTR